MFAQTDAEYAAANAEIQANGVYKIYTQSNGSSTGNTKYYLKSDGYLTDDASAAGQFTFDLQRIFGGYKMAGYRINQFTNGGDASNNFSGDALKKIITTGQNRVDWEAQVFFKGESGYAVRSTNATSTSWGASAFWTVVEDNDEDGLPNATYTVDAVPFVWQLEKVVDGDFSDVTAKYITNYNPVSNADGWTAENGNRLNQWASNPITFDAGNNCAEMWNNQGATMKQTLTSLSEGFYELTAIALAREGHITTLSAGESSVPIATVASSTVNSRGEAKTWFDNGNGRTTLSFSVDNIADVEIGLTTGTAGDAWTVWRAFYLVKNNGPIALRNALAQLKETANEALKNDAYSSVTGYERTQLTTSVVKTVTETGKPSEVSAAYNALIDEITTKLDAFKAAPSMYAQLAGENARAAMFNLPTISADEQPVLTAVDTQAKAVYNHVSNNYNTAIELGAWTTENAGDKNGQHWDGTQSTTYNEQNEGWSSNAPWTTSYSQTINLPAGDYVFKVAGRHSQNSTLTLNVKKGETVLGTVNDFPIGDTGRGIATNGSASFVEGAFYANNGVGRGWQWRYVPFTIEEENADVTISVEGGNIEAAQWQWVSFCNYTVQSAPSVAASEIAYQQAKEAAIAARDNVTYANVQGTDRSGLEAAIAADKGTTVESIDAATAAIQEATATFTAAKASWDNLANARTSASGELPYARAEKKTILDNAVAAEVTGAAADAAAQVAVIEQANRQYVESNGLAEGVDDAENKTSLITNPNADENADGWTGGFDRLVSEQYTQGDGTLGGGYFDKNGSSSYTANQTIENLAPGKYLVTVTARAQSGTTNYKVKAVNSRNEEFTADIPVVGNQGGVFGRGFNDAFVVFDQNFTGDATIGITASHSSNFWLSFDRFRLVRIADSDVTLATPEDYTALTNAINSVKDNILGFEKDEYAPYNNIEAAAMLKAAQEIDQTVENTQEAVQAATTNLTIATWNKNTEEVNAVYNGTFAATENNNAPAGWISTKNGAFSGQYMPRVFNNDDRLSEFNETKSAFFIRFDGTNSDRGTLYKYGETDGYTMPLKANTTYYVKADVKGWGSKDKPQRMNIGGPDSFAKYNELTLSDRADTDDNAPQQLLIVFTTTTAGNYVISFQCPGSDDNKHNAVVSNIELFTVPTLNLSSDATVAPEAKKVANITTDRTLLDGLNTIVLPFNTTKDEIGANTVLEYTGTTTADGTVTMNFKETETLEANVPYALILDMAATEPLAFENKEVTPSNNLTITDENGQFNFVGTYVDIAKNNTIVAAGDYVAGATAFKKAKGGNHIAAFRAYLKKVGTGDAKVAFNFDGNIVDGIEAIELLNKFSAEGIFNLQGQKVNNAQKGVYIVNGKKIVVK